MGREHDEKFGSSWLANGPGSGPRPGSGRLERQVPLISQEELKGEVTAGSCLAKGEEFAIVDDYGFVHILTPREVELTKRLNPQALQRRAYSLKYREKAPEINPLKRLAVISPHKGRSFGRCRVPWLPPW